MKNLSIFSQSQHISRDQGYFKFTRSLPQKHQHSISELFTPTSEIKRSQGIRRKSCCCSECGKMSKFQYKQMNLKDSQIHLRNKCFTHHEWKQNKTLQIQIPNLQSIRKSQASFRISRKQLLNSDESKSPLILYDSSFARASISTTQKLLEESALKRRHFKTSVFHSQDGPSPMLSSQQNVEPPKTERASNTRIKLRNNPKLLCPLLIGLSNKFQSFQKIQPSKLKHSRLKTQ